MATTKSFNQQHGCYCVVPGGAEPGMAQGRVSTSSTNATALYRPIWLRSGWLCAFQPAARMLLRCTRTRPRPWRSPACFNQQHKCYCVVPSTACAAFSRTCLFQPAARMLLRCTDPRGGHLAGFEVSTSSTDAAALYHNAPDNAPLQARFQPAARMLLRCTRDNNAARRRRRVSTSSTDAAALYPA